MKRTKTARRRKPAADPTQSNDLRWLSLMRQVAALEEAIRDAGLTGALNSTSAEMAEDALRLVREEVIDGMPI